MTPRQPAPGEDGPGDTDLARHLQGSNLLAGIAPREFALVAASSRYVTAHCGEVLFAEGQPCRALWLLVSGRVRLGHAGLDGRSQVAGFRGAGSILEVVPVFDGRYHLATATALDAVTALAIPREVVREIARRNPVIAQRAIALLCLEIRRRDIWTAISALRDSRGRLGCALSHLAREFGVPEGHGVRIAYPLTRQDLADRAGVRLETAIRVMSDLQRKEIVRTRSQTIEIVDPLALKTLLECDDCQFDCSVYAPAATALPPSWPGP